MTLLLGIDIGTSSVKAVLFDPDSASLVASANQEYPLHKPVPDRAEQAPEDWWSASVEVVRTVIAKIGRTDVAGISLCGQMHGVAFLDRSLQSVRPAIIWADQRSANECAVLIESVGATNYTAIAGTLPAAGFAAPTFLWLSRHEPQTIERTHIVLPPKDYVRFRLTGELASDPSDAAATALFDVSIKAWSPEIVAAVGIPRSILPPILDSAAVSGNLTAEAAEALGLSAGIPVITGCADQPAQALTNGLIERGKASVTVGSGGQVFVPVIPSSDDGQFRLNTDPRVHVFNHALPGMWYVLGATLTAGLSLRWLRGVIGAAEDKGAYERFSVEAAAVPLGANGLIFLPYLSGERTPHFDPVARGAFIGLSYHHERGHLARAVMEGVAFSLREALNISMEIGGSVESLIAAGGAMDSPVWRQIMADVLGIPLNQTGLTETTGIGATLLAGIGAGVFQNVADACDRTSKTIQTTEPNPANRSRYDELFAEYSTLYPKLRRDFHRLAGFG